MNSRSPFVPSRLTAAVRSIWPLAFCVVIGCGAAYHPPANESIARDSLETFLETWKSGKKVDDLSPDIVGADYAWAAGSKLLSYEILDEQVEQGPHLIVGVELNLKNPNGRQSKFKTSYVVSTTPEVSVRRDEP